MLKNWIKAKKQSHNEHSEEKTVLETHDFGDMKIQVKVTGNIKDKNNAE